MFLRFSFFKCLIFLRAWGLGDLGGLGSTFFLCVEILSTVCKNTQIIIMTISFGEQMFKNGLGFSCTFFYIFYIFCINLKELFNHAYRSHNKSKLATKRALDQSGGDYDIYVLFYIYAIYLFSHSFAAVQIIMYECNYLCVFSKPVEKTWSSTCLLIYLFNYLLS